MRYRATAAQPEREFWVAKWTSRKDTPIGIVRYTVTATDSTDDRRVSNPRGAGIANDDRGVRCVARNSRSIEMVRRRAVCVARLPRSAGVRIRHRPGSAGCGPELDEPAGRRAAEDADADTIRAPPSGSGHRDRRCRRRLPPNRKSIDLATVKGGWSSRTTTTFA